ncbi:MAG: phosphoribosylformylglycinamidine synthase subunit PurL [Conexivisphaera sp.]
MGIEAVEGPVDPADAEAVRRYFEGLGRPPSRAEMGLISQVWSEHCRHRTFRGRVVDAEGKLLVDDPLSTFIGSVSRAPWVISSLRDNAGIVELARGYGVAVKVETHNHPSAVEPFGGAATGVGGVIRDVLAVWADPVALLDVLCFGPPGFSSPPGTLSPRRVMDGVIAGIGYYGNNVGIPTLAGAVVFDEGYLGTPLVYAGCVGVLPLSGYVKDPRPGDHLVLVGNRTGRDGIAGATFASSALPGDLRALRPAVQIPDPLVEEGLVRLISAVRDSRLASGVTDLGGGGLAVAAAEMARDAGGGCEISLDAVPLREEMEAWEILVSESQERMLLSVRPGQADRVLELARAEGLEAAVIGRLTDSGRFRASFRGELVVDVDMDFLFNPPRVTRTAARPPMPAEEDPPLDEPGDPAEVLLRLLSSPNVSSREGVLRTYDMGVRGNTVVYPLEEPSGGHNDAAVVRPLDDGWEGIAISVGLKPRYSRISPYWMAASSIDEALRNNAAVGGRRVSLLDNFAWGSPERAENMWSLVEALRACRDFAEAFGTPFVSGKDSLYNESPLGSVLPTLLITAVGIVPDVRRTVTASLKSPGDAVYAVGVTRAEMGGSEYFELLGIRGGVVPRVRPDESARSMDCVVRAIDGGLAVAVHDASDGGLAVAAAEMAISGRLGLELDLGRAPSEGSLRGYHLLFSESNGRFLLEARRGAEEELERLMRSAGCAFARVGEVLREGDLVLRGAGLSVELGLREAEAAWRRGPW